MLHWGYDSILAGLVLLAAAGCFVLSYDIARVSKGPPKAWYVFMAAFAALFVYRGIELYFDTLSAGDLINDWEAGADLVATLLLLGGLWMLDLSFRRNLKQLLPAQ